MKRFLMATAMVALSVASAAHAQEDGRRGMGMRPGQGVREQQRQQEQQQAQPQQQQAPQDRGDRGGRERGDRADRGDRGDRGGERVQRRDPSGMGYRPGQNVEPQRQVQPRPDRDGRDRGDRQQFRDGRDNGGDNRRWEDRRGDNRSWRGGDRNDYRQWRGDDRRGRAWPSQQRFRIGIYSAPYGYSYRRWSFGEYLPRAYYVQQYVIRDFWNYDLPEPPYGTAWVRYGSDALLIDSRSGYVEDVIYGIFW